MDSRLSCAVRAARLAEAPGDLTTGSVHLPKRNYGFEKRQKELNKQKKREEKQQRKLERKEAADERPADAPEEAGLDDRA